MSDDDDGVVDDDDDDDCHSQLIGLFNRWGLLDFRERFVT